MSIHHNPVKFQGTIRIPATDVQSHNKNHVAAAILRSQHHSGLWPLRDGTFHLSNDIHGVYFDRTTGFADLNESLVNTSVKPAHRLYEAQAFRQLTDAGVHFYYYPVPDDVPVTDADKNNPFSIRKPKATRMPQTVTEGVERTVGTIKIHASELSRKQRAILDEIKRLPHHYLSILHEDGKTIYIAQDKADASSYIKDKEHETLVKLGLGNFTFYYSPLSQDGLVDPKTDTNNPFRGNHPYPKVQDHRWYYNGYRSHREVLKQLDRLI